MDYKIIRITAENYSKFDDMIYWRITGKQRKETIENIDDKIRLELLNTNLYIYAIEVENIYVGWISLIYLPKVGKYNGQGHIYVDELWVEPTYRNKGLAKLLLGKADDVVKELNATGVRLYVNEENPSALNLYKKCGFIESGKAHFMEK